MTPRTDKASLLPRIIRLYTETNMTPSEIGAKLGVSLSTVRRWLIASGTRMRTKEEVAKLASPKMSAARTGKKVKFSEQAIMNIRAGVRARDANRVFKGTRVRPNGYVQITAGPNAGRDQHVVLMEEILGRRMLPNEVVHHIDENRANNDPSNLVVMTRSAHTSLHRKLERARK